MTAVARLRNERKADLTIGKSGACDFPLDSQYH
jgi:hypothetical protein